MKINIGYKANNDLKKIDLSHLLLLGRTRSGKSTCAKYLLAQVIKKQIPVTIIDFKSAEPTSPANVFCDMRNVAVCTDEAKAEVLMKQLQNELNNTKQHFIVIDEVADFYDKETFKKNTVRSCLSHIIRKGAGLNKHIILTTQEPSLINASIRRQLQILAFEFGNQFQWSNLFGAGTHKSHLKQGEYIYFRDNIQEHKLTLPYFTDNELREFLEDCILDIHIPDYIVHYIDNYANKFFSWYQIRKLQPKRFSSKKESEIISFLRNIGKISAYNAHRNKHLLNHTLTYSQCLNAHQRTPENNTINLFQARS